MKKLVILIDNEIILIHCWPIEVEYWARRAEEEGGVVVAIEDITPQFVQL